MVVGVDGFLPIGWATAKLLSRISGQASVVYKLTSATSYIIVNSCEVLQALGTLLLVVEVSLKTTLSCMLVCFFAALSLLHMKPRLILKLTWIKDPSPNYGKLPQIRFFTWPNLHLDRKRSPVVASNKTRFKSMSDGEAGFLNTFPLLWSAVVFSLALYRVIAGFVHVRHFAAEQLSPLCISASHHHLQLTRAQLYFTK